MKNLKDLESLDASHNRISSGLFSLQDLSKLNPVDFSYDNICDEQELKYLNEIEDLSVVNLKENECRNRIVDYRREHL
ncbi:hypothetical protein ACOME3_010572 [Neoechinorhynchus agilis]